MARTAAAGAPLRHPAFQRLWLGLSISYLGDQFTIIALLWFVLQLTGSGAAVGLVIVCFDLPGVVTGAILGRLLDRYQPRLVMGFDNLARAALIAQDHTQAIVGFGALGPCRDDGAHLGFGGFEFTRVAQRIGEIVPRFGIFGIRGKRGAVSADRAAKIVPVA